VTAALYALSAAIAAALATRAWTDDRAHPARRAFLGLGWSFCVAWFAFALSMLPGLDSLRAAYGVFAALGAAWALRCIDLLFPQGAPSRVLPWLPSATVAVTVPLAAVHALAFGPTITASPPEIASGLVGLGLATEAVRRVAVARQAAALTVERRRLGLLLAASATSLVFTLAELATRLVAPVADTDRIAFFDRGLLLQGAVPPVGSLATAASAYVLYHTLQAGRLVALQELIARLTVISGAGVVLVVAHALTLRFVELARFPLHSSFLLFLTSTLGLSVYGTLQPSLVRRVRRRLEGTEDTVRDAVDHLLAELPGQRGADALARALARRLYAVGRFSAVSVWLFDRALDGYRLAGSEGVTAARPLERVAHSPLVDGIRAGVTAFVRDRLDPRAPDRARVLGLLDAMGADLLVPIRHGDAVLGWLGARDEAWSDGFTHDEQAHLDLAASRAGLVLANLEGFKRLEEQQRLAAIGTMAAGLAHEIRNPLAGIKGAAQVLEAEPISEDARDMLTVILDETGRLDRVVSRFLDFARPFRIDRAPGDLNGVVARALTVVRAAGLPEGVDLREQLDPALPQLPLDGERLTQVVLNLVQNALQAVGDAGLVCVSTERRVSLGGAVEVELTVTDDGAGVPPEARAQLFTPFFTTRARGSGLGLALSRRIAQAHGGDIELLSPAGPPGPRPGARVIVRLPCLDP
jgi:signal transduction histidine kinase